MGAVPELLLLLNRKGWQDVHFQVVLLVQAFVGVVLYMHNHVQFHHVLGSPLHLPGVCVATEEDSLDCEKSARVSCVDQDYEVLFPHERETVRVDEPSLLIIRNVGKLNFNLYCH